jgi:hypothetical protein
MDNTFQTTVEEMLQIVEELKKEVERLRVVEQAYEAMKKAVWG